MKYSVIDTAKYTEELLNTSEVCKGEIAKLAALIKKYEEREIIVSVIGQFKRGKSAVVNRFLEEKLLPVGIIPVTSVVTRIHYGKKCAKVHFKNGSVKSIEFNDLSEYVSEQENPDNKYGVSYVELQTNSEFLRDGVIFVDTPGVGSIHKNNSEAAYNFVKESDAVIFLISVDSPINEIEIKFLSSVKKYAAKLYFAVNKIDIVEDEELSLYLEYCENLLCKLMEINKVSIFPISAKSGAGLVKLKESIQNDCQTARTEILEGSVSKKLEYIIDCSLAQLELHWKGMVMPIGKLDYRFRKLKEKLQYIKEDENNFVIDFERKKEDYLKSLKEKSEICLHKLSENPQEKFKDILLKFYEEQMSEIYAMNVEMSNNSEIYINQVKINLSDLVSELFGVEYHYELGEVDILSDNLTGSINEGNKLFASGMEQPKKLNIPEIPEEAMEYLISALSNSVTQNVSMIKKKSKETLEYLCTELEAKLNLIFLYREESSFAVAYRIDNLNKVIEQLKKTKYELKC